MVRSITRREWLHLSATAVLSSAATAGVFTLATGLQGCEDHELLEALQEARPYRSTIEHKQMYSEQLRQSWNYDVYVPESYDPNGTRKYPVIYLLHGLTGDYLDFLEDFDSQGFLDDAATATDNPCIAVFVDGFNSWYIDQINGLHMESAIMQELVPAIERDYRIASRREAHAIAGLSMGGFGAALLSLKHSDYFAFASCWSPAVRKAGPSATGYFARTGLFTDGKDPWNYQVYLRNYPTTYLPPAQKVEFFVATGEDDDVVLVEDVEDFVRALRRADLTVDFQVDPGYWHDNGYWGNLAPEAYEWLLERLKV